MVTGEEVKGESVFEGRGGEADEIVENRGLFGQVIDDSTYENMGKELQRKMK